MLNNTFIAFHSTLISHPENSYSITAVVDGAVIDGLVIHSDKWHDEVYSRIEERTTRESVEGIKRLRDELSEVPEEDGERPEDQNVTHLYLRDARINDKRIGYVAVETTRMSAWSFERPE